MGSEHPLQGINLPLSQRSSILNTGGLVASPFTGAVNDTVLLFSAAGAVTGPAAFIVETNDADAGTSVLLTRAGVYVVQLYLQQAPTQASTIGISQDVAAPGLAGRPSFAIAGFTDVLDSVSVAAQNPSIPVSSTVEVDNDLVAVGGSVIRFHGSTTGGAAPTGDFNQANPYYRIRLINALHA